ncbi:MARTX multifunctional-autoprocessing repeats-in-toxin holotoxin RtxA [Photorhabdus hindustanensis]|uniref:MARTX multifunctional-autoprocessing repeats-in-toxin holotoxin RtxA n=1 Tax=Photorhabdus hindustanensis TaxID=2918802 RepID=A0A2S8PV08_9GAMM|nr:MARTX multifunctional-autoprocessing repeats-in-toxin holotoxin RtxA [Photorhabdus hindustanensis]PQQ22702.1 MARTX multifunctional-autoprocessing repeats-in-toxin holotoxin RtxA [Photorhabdus hindustanensis]
MGKSSNRSTEYFFTGKYYDDNDGNSITAIGVGGEVYAYGGNDDVTVGSLKVDVYHTDGDLAVKGASGYAGVSKTGNGGLSFAGAAGAAFIHHTGKTGNLNYSGAAGYNKLVRKGLSGDTNFKGAGGYNKLWHETNRGNLDFAGAGAYNDIDHTWFNRYQDSQGNVTFNGAGAANSISSRVESGSVTFNGAGADNHIVRKGKEGNIILRGAGASNRIERVRQNKDGYEQTRGDITFEGAGGYNKLYSDVAHGNINFSGAGAYNEITRIGADSDFDGKALEFAKAEEIVLTTATMGGSWIQKSQQVTGIKSAVEPNTYLFAFADKMYTKISKVQLQNNPTTGRLGYHATSWYKAGNHLKNLAAKEISSGNGFVAVNANGAYRLSSLVFERQQPIEIHAIEESLLIDQWVTYAGGMVIKAEDISLGDAKMGGYAIFSDDRKVDVSAVKSNRQPNTYVYAKVMGSYTKIVKVQLKNDPDTGQLKYRAEAWYKAGDHTGNLANKELSYANGYTSIGPGYTLSQLQYNVNTVRRTSHRLVHSEEYSQQDLAKSPTSSGYVNFNGVGGGNVIKSNVTRGNVNFKGAGAANVILHGSKFGDTNFDGAGAANVIVKSGEKGDLTFHGAGLANVLVHQGQSGKMDVYAGGAVNVLVRVGDGQYLAHLLAYGNISIHKGNGNSRVLMLGGYNTHSQIGNGNGNWSGAGGFNVITQAGAGDISSVLLGGANVLTKLGAGDLVSGMFGGANIITHLSDESETADTTAIALGGANILTKKGKGNALAVMGGGANVLTHIGDGNTTGVMLGGANVLTKIGKGDTTGIMFGIGNVLTHVGDGLTLGVMAAAGNIFTKVGEGTSIAAMIGVGSLFTHVGKGDAWALMGGAVNVFTKVGNGNALALMIAAGNVFTHIGDGTTVALMLAKGNIATKVGHGMTLAAMIGKANIFTHVGDGNTFAAMIGGANVLTKVGNDLTAALMIGKANIYSHVGDSASIGLFAGELNVMTKVGKGTTLAAMFGKANMMTHVGKGLTGVLALGEANIVTKVGDDFMGVVAAAKANVITHVGDATTAGILFGKGNILTKVGDGTTVGLLISDVGNVMTHVGKGTTVGFAKGKANLMTKIGDGVGVNAAWGEANILTQVGNGERYNFAKGKANIITKVGNGQEVTVVQGDANLITHVGNGDDYTGAWGQANVITKVGDGQNVVLAKGRANIVTQVGKGDSFNALWSEGNIVTKVGDGMQITAAKGKANVTTTVGNGLNVTAAHGDVNINTHVGNGVSVNVAWGKYNVNTKVGNGLNVAVMKGQGNADIQVGHGLYVNASYARNNVAIKIGDGDFYSLAVASSNTESNKLASFFNNIKQTVLGVGGSQAINYLVHGDEANTSGTHRGRGAINLTEVSAIDGFKMEEIDQVGSDLSSRLSRSVTAVEVPDINSIESSLAGSLNRKTRSVSDRNENLIVNGDFEQGNQGWQSTNGVEAYNPANAYGLNNAGHGKRVSELDVDVNTTLSQELQNLSAGEVVSLSFDFAKRSGLASGEGMDVLWNGKSIFSTSGNEVEWQNKALQLTAQEGANRIEFKGTGWDDGLGYILDNVVVKSEMSLILNGDFERGDQSWQSTNGVEAYHEASAYGLDNAGHGSRVSELDVDISTTIYQDLRNRSEGEVISLSFDFAKRANSTTYNEGMEVLWNGESKFTITNGDTAWQSKTLELIAKAGTNRIEFKGIGDNNGIGYILDNVVAKSVGTLPANSVIEHARQDQAAKNALSDKEKAEKDRQLLEREKEKQLSAIEKSKSQLESTDQEALSRNGQEQGEAIKEEAQAVTKELTLIADNFKQLKDETDDSRELDSHYLDYAGGISEEIQKRLDNVKPTLEKRLTDIHRNTIDTQQKVKDAVALSEAGAEKGKQNRDKAILDGVDAQFKADQRKEEALSQQQQAEKAKDSANIAYQNAERRGKRDTAAAENKAAQAQADAKGAKLNDSRPARIGTSGSGWSGEKAYESTGAGEIGSHIDPESMLEARNRYYQGLTEEELQALENAKQAVNRLQINAGIRAKNTGASLIPRSVETQSDSIVVLPLHETRELIRKASTISGINLEGLGGSKKRAIDSSVLSRAQKIAHIYRWLDNGNDNASDEYIPIPGFKRVNAEISGNTRQNIVAFIERHLRNPKVKHKVPENEIASLAKLFVDATLDYDWDKRVEFIAKLDSYGHSFEAARDDKSIVSFWSGKSFRRHRDVLEAAQPDGKKIVYDVDVQGNAFAIQLNQHLMKWKITYLSDNENNRHNALRAAIDAATYSNTGFWSSIYAAGSRGDVYLISEGGLRLGNYFWNVELPVLRKLQREGLVGEILLLDKPASEYKGLPTELIGRRLTEAGITVKARFDALTIEEQEKRLAVNPGGYKADTVIDLDIKLSAVDTMLNQALPFYGLRTERNLLVQKSDEGFEVRSWPGNGNEFKRIIVKNTTSNNLLKAVERFILANYDNYAQLPDELYFMEDRIISHHQGHTRILADKVNGIWKPVPELMSVSEFHQAASIAGKMRGDSYQKVIDALESYHHVWQGRKDDELDVIGKLSDLRQQVEGYLLGHPDSGRAPAMKALLSQIDTRFEESMALTESTVRIPEQGDFSSLYDKLGSANLKDSKHLYVDENGDFVTRGKANIHINQKAESADKAIEQVKAAVIKEYGQDVSDAVFSNLKASDLSQDGKGIDVSGLRKIYQAIENVSTPSGSQSKDHNVEKKSLFQEVGYTIFDLKADGKQLADYSFHFSQNEDLLGEFKKLIPEISNVLVTNGNDVQSKEFLEGICFALSSRYMMEERVNGVGGGKAYIEWLQEVAKAYNDNSVNKKTDINSIESSLLNRYRRQKVGPAIEKLLSIQHFQQLDAGSLIEKAKGNVDYSARLKANGLTGARIGDPLNYEVDGYESVMEQLRNVKQSTYMMFMSEDHAMSVVVHKSEAQTIWSFFDPNFGAKSFDNYDDFHRFMDSFHKGLITGYRSPIGYKYASASPEDSAKSSFYINYNTFEDSAITGYDNTWKQAREGEQSHVLHALKEQEIMFSLDSGVEGWIADYREGVVTLEVMDKKGQKVFVEVESNNFKQAASFVQLNIGKIFADPTASKLTLKGSKNGDATVSVLEKLSSDAVLKNTDVESWERISVTPQTDGRETRFDGQIIIQMEDDPVAAKAAANLAGKHPDSSVVVQLDSEGKYRVVYGDSSQFKPSDKLRWQIVGHGRSESEQNNTRLSGYSADELAIKLKQFTQSFSQVGKPDHISIVGCSLISDDKRDGFAHHFITALKEQDIHTTVSARRSEVAIDVTGRKFTQNENNQWINNLTDNKVILSWNEKGELETHSERVRHNIAESDINLSRVGIADADMPAKGAIVDNADIFTAPEKRKNKIETDSSHISNNQISYSGNIQVDVGNGEFTALNWGTSNVGIKAGTGGFKSLAFGDNNVMVHIGNGDSKHSVDIAGYQALEGAQMFIGNRNVSFNQGRSNDLIVMMDKSLPTPPLVNPFDGAARISGVLQSIAHSGEEQEWLAAQDQQWTIAGAKKFVQDMSGLDQTSSVDYKTLVDLGSQHERSSRGLRSDTEAALNKKFNQWLSKNGNSVDMSNMSRADKFRQANEKLAFNFAVGGQGADIQVTTGNWNFMFGDNIQSLLDTNLGSLFSLMTQQYSTTGIAKTTFTYNPQDLPRQLKNKLLGRLASVNADTTLADIFGVDYTADGRIVSRGDEPVDGVAILKEMIEVIGEFSGEQLKVFTDPDKLLDGLKSHLNMGTDGIKSFAESHGLKQKDADKNEERQSSTPATVETESAKPERAFGFHSLNLPNLFATMFSKDKQEEMKSLVTNLKENLTADLLNMEQKTFDFLRNSGHLQGDSDIHVSLGNYNFNWGGDGKDLGAYLGDNNNFWGGRGDDVYYSIGTSNIFAGGAGNDLGVLMGRENWMFGGNGDDTAVVAGRINHVFMGDGNDQTFVFGEGGLINTDKGQDYVVTSGNYNRVDTGEDQDYAVTIGNNNRVELGEGNDFARVFGNDNQIDGNAGNDVIKLLGYHVMINGGEGDDHLIAATISKFSQFDGGDGQDLLVLGGYQNRFQGGTGVDSFVVSGKVIDSQIDDINVEDMIVFDGIDWQNLWFQRSGYDLVLSVNRHTEDKTAQGAFESIGSVTFSNYFDGNRAKLVAQMGDKSASGEREFTALSDNAVDTLIQSMSSFAPTAGDNGFIENLDNKAIIAITTAWSDTTIGKAQFA